MNKEITTSRKTIVVIGNGMVGHRFCEKLIELDQSPSHDENQALDR